jgi:signal transduction histidine kinase
VSSVEDLRHEPGGRRWTWWSAAVQWRNWPLLVKLGMVLVLPVVSALALGVLRVQADVELADDYRNIERIANVRVQLVSVLSAVEYERGEAVRADGQFELATRGTDQAVNTLTDVVRESPDLGESAASGYRALARALDSLPSARRQVGDSAPGMVVLSAYNAVTTTVIEFDRSLAGSFPDENLTGTSIAVAELQAAREQAALQQAVGNLALREGALPDAGRQQLIEADVRLRDKLDDFGSVAPPALWDRYESVVGGQDVTARQQMVDAARTSLAGMPFTQQQWNDASNGTNALLANVTKQAAVGLRTDSGELAEIVSDRAGLETVLLLTMVLLAAGIGGGLGRYLLRSVGVLRRTALEVAHERLPAAVESIRAGEAAKVSVDPVPVRTTEEFGQLARAFDAVHDQAVRSAAEEASLRGSLANIFTNLSRRSQGLVERQLRLMEQLEQKTEDPEQLANLFKIDHLATRMRRNNENLMVLSGTALLRRFTEPMPLPDVLRAAISEVEHYQRAVVRSVPEVRVAGYAAGDLIRSVSELIENATAFSPPDSQVTVASRLLGDGAVVIDIIDQGVGMSEADLADANERIAGGGGVDVPISRQMGLFVVGRLTSRHGIQVRLIPRAEGGLCAAVLVPSGLVTAPTPAPTPSAPPAPSWLDTAGPQASRPDLPVLPKAQAPEVPAAANTERLWPVTPASVEPPVEVPAVSTPWPAVEGPAPSVPAEVFEPAEVTGMLESAGIIVSLPALPSATTPASILFAAGDVGENGGAGGQGPGFTWLNASGEAAAAAAAATTATTAAPVATQPAPVTTGPAGLPKRVPKGQRTLNREQPQSQPPAATRDAARARGFLSGFQAGVRRSENRGETGP